MLLKFSEKIPIYVQLERFVESHIMCGEWQPGQKVPSIRTLAVQFGVNSNTIQRALKELEQKKLLYCERTTGRYVTKNTTAINQFRDEASQKHINYFCNKMNKLGFTGNQILELITRGDSSIGN